ncbi:hypothetical protein DITRI_Ditri01bG0056700 [Diplodiscus trichospermus]
MELFAKVLTNINVERRLFLTQGCFPSLPQSEGCRGIELQVKDDCGILWNFGCIKRSWAKQKLSGWFQFVRSKELHAADIVIFHREDDIFTEAHYKIELKRKNISTSSRKKEI